MLRIVNQLPNSNSPKTALYIENNQGYYQLTEGLIDTGCSEGRLWISPWRLKELNMWYYVDKTARPTWSLKGPDGRKIRPLGSVRLPIRHNMSSPTVPGDFWVLPKESSFDVVFGEKLVNKNIDYKALEDETWRSLEERSGTLGGFGSSNRETPCKGFQFQTV